MRAGRLRHYITIQTVTITNDVESWADTHANVPASIEPLRGREFWESQTVSAETAYRVTIRYRSGVLPTMRVKWGTRIFRINAVLNIEERNRELHLMCVEVV